MFQRSLVCILFCVIHLLQASDYYLFDASDLKAEHQDELSGEKLIFEAFRSTLNREILGQKQQSRYSELSWVSLGVPRLTPSNSSISSIFTFNTRGFLIKVQTIADEHKRALVNAVKEKYQVSVRPSQISNLPNVEMKCSLEFENESGNTVQFVGEMSNQFKYPFRVQFEVSQYERPNLEWLQSLIKTQGNKLDLEFGCIIKSTSRTVQENEFKLTSGNIKELSLVENLFGDAARNSIYVTRSQLESLAGQVYAEMSIAEEFQMRKSDFLNQFILGFLEQTASEVTDEFVEIDKALESVSFFGTSASLTPSEIQTSLIRVFLVETTGSKTRIVKNSNTDTNMDVLKILFGSFESKANYSGLAELNKQFKNRIEWELDATTNTIVPSHVKVFQLFKADLRKRDLVFSDIKRTVTGGSLNKAFVLNTNDCSPESVKPPSPSTYSLIQELKGRNFYTYDSFRVTNKIFFSNKAEINLTLKDLRDQVIKGSFSYSDNLTPISPKTSNNMHNLSSVTTRLFADDFSVVRKVEVRFNNKQLYGMRFLIGDISGEGSVWTEAVGSANFSNSSEIWSVPRNECITKIEVSLTDIVDSVRFFTNKDTRSREYGSKWVTGSSQDPFQQRVVHLRGCLVGMEGRSFKEHVGQVRFISNIFVNV
jgi:hypothetical protein